MRKRQRTLDLLPNPNTVPPPDNHSHPPGAPPVTDDAFINDQDAVDSAADDDEEEEKPKSDKKAGRRKIKIEFIQDKSRRHITFSKRKAGIMKKAYELSTLTGTQVLLLVVSETGLVYTFTTAKLQPLVTQPEGKNLIQACLNAPHGSLPSSSMPVGTPLGRSSGPMNMPGPPSATNNLPGGLSISGSPSTGIKEDDVDGEEDEVNHGGRSAAAGDKRRRRASSTTGGGSSSTSNTRGGAGGPTSPLSPNTTIPPPLSIPPPSQHQQQQHQQQQQSPQSQPQQSPQQQQQQPPPQISLGSPTSPQQQHQQVPPSPAQQYSPSYGGHGSHHQHSPHQHDTGIYTGHMMAPSGPYSYPGPGGPGTTGGGQQLGGLAAAAAQQHHWAPGPQPPQVSQSGHYARR